MGEQAVKNYPYPPEFRNFADVREYLIRLYVALKEAKVDAWTGEVYYGEGAPSEVLGEEGDLYIDKG